MSKKESGFNLIYIIIFVAVLIAIGLIVYFTFLEKRNAQKLSNSMLSSPSAEASTSAQTNSSLQAPENIPDGWTNLTTDMFTIWYPSDYSMDEVMNNVFEFYPPNQQGDEDALIKVDASLTNNNNNFDIAYSNAKTLLHNQSAENLPNGVKIFGYTIGGYGESLPRRITLFNYNNAAIQIQTTTTDPAEIAVYDGMVLSFKLLN